MSVPLAATEYGSGAPLLVLHGLFGSGRNWASVAQALARTHHVFALDLRNHGASPWAESMDYADVAGDVAAFMAARGLGRASVLGHSMGGKAAMMLALRRAELVERLLVVDVAPASYPPVLLAYVRAMRAVDLGAVRRRADADAALAAAIPDAAERGFILQNLLLEPHGARWRINLEALEAGLPGIAAFPRLPEEARYEGATLFVAGARSTYVRPEHEGEIKRRFPEATITRIPDAGHWVHAEQPNAFLEAVTPFLTV